jgi:hypothetical protein
VTSVQQGRVTERKGGEGALNRMTVLFSSRLSASAVDKLMTALWAVREQFKAFRLHAMSLSVNEMS